MIDCMNPVADPELKGVRSDDTPASEMSTMSDPETEMQRALLAVFGDDFQDESSHHVDQPQKVPLPEEQLSAVNHNAVPLVVSHTAASSFASKPMSLTSEVPRFFSNENVEESYDGRPDEVMPRRMDQDCNENLETSDHGNGWSAIEDETIIEAVREHGFKWRLICEAVPGRTSDSCRGRWNRLQKKVRNTNATTIQKRSHVHDQTRHAKSGRVRTRTIADHAKEILMRLEHLSAEELDALKACMPPEGQTQIMQRPDAMSVDLWERLLA